MKKTSILLIISILIPIYTIAQTVILSGVDGGSYNQMANDLKNISHNPQKILVIPSTGSIDNYIRLINEPEVTLSFLQEDVMNYQQLVDLEEGTDFISNLRILLNLGTEEVHLIVKKDSKYNSLRDLKNKKVAIGDKNQGTQVTAKLIKEYADMKWKNVEIPFDSAFTWLLNDKIDAFFFVGAAPVSKLSKLPQMANLRLLPLTDSRLGEIYTPATIASGTYKWQDEAIETYAVKSLLVANTTKRSPEYFLLLDSLLVDLKNNFETLKKNGHKKWANVRLNTDNIDWEVYENASKIYNPKPPLSDDLVILSGLQGGSYNQMALDLKNILPQIKVNTSSGSLYNMKEIILRESVYITFLQKDVLDYQKLEDLKDGTHYTSSIKAILPAGYEEIHLIARKASNIKQLKDLKDKKVGIGTIHQGTRVTANLIKEVTGTKWLDEPLPFDSAMAAITTGKIDAFFFVGAAPVSALKNIPTQAGLELVSIADIKNLEEFYTKVTIPANTYTWQTEDINTFATQAVIVTNTKNETEGQQKAIIKLLETVKANKESLLKQGHPKWQDANFDVSKIKWEVYPFSKTIFK